MHKEDIVPNRVTLDAYNNYASAYDQSVIEFWQNFPMDSIERFAQETPGKRVLDLGSGSGRDAVLLRDRALDVVCVDGAQGMVDLTTRLGFESHLCDFLTLPFDDASFDGIWAYCSLIHVPIEEVRRVLAVLHGLLRPGGTFAFGAIEGEPESRMTTHSIMPGAKRYFRFYQPDELCQLVQDHGFRFVAQSSYRPGRTKVYFQQLFRRV